MSEKFSHFPSPKPISTGEAFSARFENRGESANDTFFDRRKKEKLKPEESDEGLNGRYSEYSRIALAPDGGLEKAIAAWKKDSVENWLVKNGVLKIEHDRPILTDSQKLISSGWSSWGGENQRNIRWKLPNNLREKFDTSETGTMISIDSADFLTYLNGLEAENELGESKPVTTFPASEKEAFDSSYPDCHLKPWEILSVNMGLWDQTLVLKDGTITNIAELNLAQCIREFNITNITPGKFSLIDPKSGEQKKVSGKELIRDYFNHYGSNKTLDIRNQPDDFAQRYLPNLDRLGILHPSDFKKFSNTFDASIVAPSDRQLTQAPQVSLRTPGGKSLQYYLGREKIVGTDIPFDRKSMVLRFLDRNTCGIVRKEKSGFEEVLCTFPLLSPEEVERRRSDTKNELLSRGISISEHDLSARTHVNGKDMAKLVRKYNVSDYLPPFSNESPKEYADRISKLNDARLVSGETRDFFRQSGVGIHVLPWAEQLMAGSILTDPRFKKETIGQFCKTYGIDGLRTFISSTYGKNINKEILSLSRSLPEEVVAEIFRAYSSIINSVSDIQFYLKTEFQKEESSAVLTAKITENLLNKGKALLLRFPNEKELDPNQLIAQLNAATKSNALLTSSIKALRDSGELHSLSEVTALDTREYRGSEIPPELRSAMRELYSNNYPLKKKTRPDGYTEKFRQELIHGLESAFENTQSRFHIITKDGQLAVYMRFEDRDTDALGRTKKYFGSFNVAPELQYSRIGETSLTEVLNEEKIDSIIEALADPIQPITQHYLEKNGFVATGIEPVADRPLLKIELDTKLNDRLLSKRFAGFTAERIKSLAEAGETPREYLLFQKFPSPAAITFPGNGWLMTRSIQNQNGSVYAVFEQDPGARN